VGRRDSLGAGLDGARRGADVHADVLLGDLDAIWERSSLIFAIVALALAARLPNG
jgi:hypothetical protein